MNNIEQQLKVRIPWNKGKKTKPHTEEWKENMSKIAKEKGFGSWMVGKKASEETKRKMRETAIRLNCGERLPKFSGDKSHCWKGDEAGLTAKHLWVVSQRGRPQKCDHCETVENRTYHWSNISGEYKRDVDDYQRLCVPCHRKYDYSNKIHKKND